MLALLDTNILLDFFLQRQPFYQNAEDLLVANQNGTYTAYVSSLTPATVYYFARKLQGDAQARIHIQAILTSLKVIAVTQGVLSQSLGLPISDYEDGIQVGCAISENLDAIVTRDAKDYKNSPIPVYDPAAFLKLL